MQAITKRTGFDQPRPALHRPRVLLVDEDARDRDHYFRMLHDIGFDVRAYPDFAEAARLLETAAFDCAIVSQGGPPFKGRVVLEQSIARDRSRPVVILCRHHDVRCYLDAMQLGAVEYLEKPVSAVEILRAVTTHLPPRRAAA